MFTLQISARSVYGGRWSRSVIWSSLARPLAARGVAVFGCCMACLPQLRLCGLTQRSSLFAKIGPDHIFQTHQPPWRGDGQLPGPAHRRSVRPAWPRALCEPRPTTGSKSSPMLPYSRSRSLCPGPARGRGS
jgi:hypothetical protein